MPYIICKDSGYEARRRVVRLQKDLIRQCYRHKDNEKKAVDDVSDFEHMSEESGLFKSSGKSVVKRANFIKGKDGEIKENG